jgi:hypothetical protein
MIERDGVAAKKAQWTVELYVGSYSMCLLICMTK